ncbi:hypothetical protein MVES1_003213 [Malassezia vespertilionis]|uniref:VHS domain-containing protein n=1 Tax=Malassezia vespertilionis TaxID=2020962 RepID=A0A2N1J9M5_9BASI|nr:uncharacterized protein MVES1_003213 [Malassezia vespertilionis]PKI83257.1 hypothetical protein MVES_003055 [Malassezia vespertilionis]WFD07846.1 hypothetical protein MVES1_003213 [Malassezia vespertilionis]
MRRFLARKSHKPQDEERYDNANAPMVPPEEDALTYPTYGETRAVDVGRGKPKRSFTPLRPKSGAQDKSISSRNSSIIAQAENWAPWQDYGAPASVASTRRRVHSLTLQGPNEVDDASYATQCNAQEKRVREKPPLFNWKKTMGEHHKHVRRAPRSDALRVFAPMHAEIAKQSAKQDPSEVATRIAAFCNAAPSGCDWQEAHALGDYLNHSDAHSKEAVRVLRAAMRSNNLEVQRRAVHAWGIWSLFAGGTFGAYAANAQLLGTLEELLDNSLTFPALREDILDVLSALTYRAKSTQRLRPVARLWSRVRPASCPEHGEPMRRALFSDREDAQSEGEDVSDDSHEKVPAAAVHPERTLLTIPTERTPQGARPPPKPLRLDADARTPTKTALPAMPGPGPEYTELAPYIPSPLRAGSDGSESPMNDDVQRECQVAHANASVLLDALAFQGVSNPLVPEFSHNAQLSRDWLEAQCTRISDEAQNAALGNADPDADALFANILDALSHVDEALAECDRLYELDANDANGHESEQSSTEGDEPALPPEPVQPSAKALGKRREVDPRMSSKPPLPAPPAALRENT